MPPGVTGAAFTNRLARGRFVTNQILLNGSGTALGDVNGDGRCDVFLAGLDVPNALFLNLGGWRFTNAAETAGVALPGLDCSGAALADLDGDDDLDLVVNTVAGGTHLLLNDGQGRFSPAPSSPFNPVRGGMSLTMADVDGDGDLDVYVANYRADTFRDQPGTRFRGRYEGGRMVLHTVNGRPVTEPDLEGRYSIEPSGRILEHGEPDLFLRNDGGGRFTPEPLTGGRFFDAGGRPLARPPYDWTLAALLRDLDGDGAPDLYVCNDFQDEDLLWLNDGSGRFRPAPPEALRRTSRFSMSVDVADVDRDGHDDLFTADMLSRTHARRQTKLGEVPTQLFPPGEGLHRPQFAFNQLQLGRGDGTFAETAWQAGVAASDWTWNAVFLDVDLDGWEDLLLGTGHELDQMDSDLWAETERRRAGGRLDMAGVRELKLLFPRLNLPNFAYRNLGKGRFTDAGAAWRFELPVITHGLALGDLDGDGDLDAVLNNLNDPASFLRNDAPAPRVLVRLRGRPANTRGVGATIRVLGGPAPQSQQITAGGRYLSGDDAARCFAARAATSLTVEVRWRSGLLSVVSNVAPGLECVVEEPARGPRWTPPAPPAPLFVELPGGLAHTHHETPFDDFARQPLLPHRLSQLGPGAAAADLDGDGWEDLVLGTGAGGRPAAFCNTGGRLALWTELHLPLVERDVLGLITWPLPSREPALLVALANWEDGTTNGAAVELWNLRSGSRVTVLPAGAASPGALAATDFDADGDLDVFIGGRAVPGRYPEPAASVLLVNVGGSLLPEATVRTALAGRMITGALWADLDADGFPELVCAADWGPVSILKNERGRLAPLDPPVKLTDFPGPGSPPATLGSLTGLWTGIAAVDLDGDGRMDLVAGNWGRNSRWQLRGDQPLRLYHGDFMQDGTVTPLEAVAEPELGGFVPLRTWRPVMAALPFVGSLAASHAAFSRLTLPALLDDRAGPRLSFVEAATLDSVVLLNRGDYFEVRPLPPPAQAAPVFAVVPGDFDGDGHEDVFLSQNFFAVHGDAARLDAGRGLLLRGDGTGALHADGRGGVVAWGEQRAAVTADFDRDGRPDLVVTQNAAPTRVFRNSGARPGLRVRLAGPPGNPHAVGAVVRTVSAGRAGPWRAVTAGSGWLSQHAAAVIPAASGVPDAIEVRWPGGTMTRIAVPPGSREIQAARSGE